MNRCFLIAVLAAGSLWFSPAAECGSKYALVVGISDYPGTLLDLPLVTEDVSAITSMLTGDLDFDAANILVLESEQATRRAILKGITKFLGQAGDDDLAVFYYSGHGTRVDDNVAIGEPFDPEADGQDEALVAHDELLIDDELDFALSSIDAGRLLVLFDSCHSGDATRADLSVGMPKSAEFSQLSKYIELPDDFQIPNLDAQGGRADANREGRLFIAASGENELSWVAPNLGLSLFTYFLTEKIAASGDKTFEEFVAELSPRVNQYAQQYFQVPQSTHLESSPDSAKIQLDQFFRVAASP